MKRTTVVVLLLLAACGNKKSDPGTGTGSAAPVQRPSELPQTQMEKLVSPDDPKRTEKIALGHALFFDKRLSGNNDRSCYSCHMNEDGNGGHDPIAIGSGDKKLTRHSPVIWNVGYWKGHFYWDGRAKTLEDNVKGAWALGNMGGTPADTKPEEQLPILDKKAVELGKIDGYKKLFEAAFPGASPKAEHAIGAIAEYMRTMVCNDTAFDKFAAGKKDALTDSQKRGLDIFLLPQKGNCIMCHAPPFFSNSMGTENPVFYNVGIGTQVPEDKVDIGRMKVSKQEVDWAAFKIPSLRNVAKSAPYFHDGSVAKLEDAVKLMTTGGIANKNKFAMLTDRKLSAGEIADLLSFLQALDCPNKLEEPKLP